MTEDLKKDELEKLQSQEPEKELLPSDIIFNEDEDDDSDMPLPETANYDEPKKENPDDNKILLPTQKFYKLFDTCMGKLPYSSVLKNSNNEQIKLIDLFRFIESKTSGITVKEMNTIISFVASSPLEFVRPFMELVENGESQRELWVLK